MFHPFGFISTDTHLYTFSVAALNTPLVDLSAGELYSDTSSVITTVYYYL